MAANKNSGRFAYDGLERVIHEKARLSIMSSLAANPQGLLFNDLKSVCVLTDGNLSRHLQMLEEAGLVELTRDSDSRGARPQTLCKLSAPGRKRFLDYIAELERVVQDAAKAASTSAQVKGVFG